MKEEEIRPQILFDKLLKLNKEDIDTYFSSSSFTIIECPACGNKGTFAFNKDGFNFDECHLCKTLYVSPRPDKNSFNGYYTDSKSTKFWASDFYKATEVNRREKLWKPKAKLIQSKIEKYLNDTKCIVDIGGGYGIFIEEFLKINKLDHLIIEPSNYLSKICKDNSLNVLQKFMEDVEVNELSADRKIFVSFELFEHLHDPAAFLDVLFKLMSKGDGFVFTTLSSTGVDIQALWEDSKSISPPMHLNFFNPKSISLLLERIGFKVLEVTTPGKLDIDILFNNKERIKDRFWKTFIDFSSEQEKIDMQCALSDNNLSSHMMIVCEKR